MAVLPISPNSEEGSIQVSNAAWATAYGATTGTLDKLSGTTSAVSSSYQSNTYTLNRGFIAFPLTSIPFGSTIISVHLTAYMYIFTGGTIYLNQGTQSDTLVAGDFDQVTTTNYATFSGVTDWTSADLTLNASGISYVQTNIGGVAKFCLRDNYDHLNSAPPGINNQNAAWRNQTWETPSERPILVVTYIPPGGSFISELL